MTLGLGRNLEQCFVYNKNEAGEFEPLPPKIVTLGLGFWKSFSYYEWPE